MSRISLTDVRLEPARGSGAAEFLRWLVLGLFIAQWALVWVRAWLFPAVLGASHRWPEGVLLVLAIAATLAWLTRQQPAQNVMLASIIITALGGAAHTLGALTGIPFGPFSFTVASGQ